MRAITRAAAINTYTRCSAAFLGLSNRPRAPLHSPSGRYDVILRALYSPYCRLSFARALARAPGSIATDGRTYT